jgi:hypothetical protein
LFDLSDVYLAVITTNVIQRNCEHASQINYPRGKKDVAAAAAASTLFGRNLGCKSDSPVIYARQKTGTAFNSCGKLIIFCPHPQKTTLFPVRDCNINVNQPV